ncbi:hypothetical protein CLHUN_02030 [Ruminiclostridium hungatei]|uniref:Uncharacterized protein n=1 Tax=Ruminiclostridium hungatei TaxID=48256 RepID=A0A1V4ST15_RUMHU|nr:hypothetical protein [Ruminiclostridium hungatei]OPX46387.1 hypothetical protein CLHUN_02030 [Ruminiclostridium hungatei]
MSRGLLSQGLISNGKLSGVSSNNKKYLYDAGNECVGLTGGWDRVTGGSGGVVENANNVFINSAFAGNSGLFGYNFSCYSTAVAVPLGAVTTLRVTLSQSTNTGGSAADYFEIFLSSSRPTGTSNPSHLAAAQLKTTGGITTILFDITNINNQSLFVTLSCINGFNVNVTKVWIE